MGMRTRAASQTSATFQAISLLKLVIFQVLHVCHDLIGNGISQWPTTHASRTAGSWRKRWGGRGWVPWQFRCLYEFSLTNLWVILAHFMPHLFINYFLVAFHVFPVWHPRPIWLKIEHLTIEGSFCCLNTFVSTANSLRFLEGCMMIKGPARSIDVVCIKKENWPIWSLFLFGSKTRSCI